MSSSLLKLMSKAALLSPLQTGRIVAARVHLMAADLRRWILFRTGDAMRRSGAPNAKGS